MQDVSSAAPMRQPAGAGVIALVLAALFAGAAIHIAIAEQPARLALADPSLLLEWQTSFSRAARMQAGLAILASLAAFLAFWRERRPLWLAGGTLMLANLPYTLIAVMPLNEALLALGTEQAGAASRAMIERWGGLHLVRVGLSLAGIAAFSTALLRGRWRGTHSAWRK